MTCPENKKKSKDDNHLASSAVTMQNDIIASDQRSAVDQQSRDAFRKDSCDPIECTLRGRFAHPADNCICQLCAIGLLVDLPRAGMRDKKKETWASFGDEKHEEKLRKVSALRPDGRTIMFKPTSIAGLRFRRCLIDTRSQAIIISCILHSPFSPD